MNDADDKPGPLGELNERCTDGQLIGMSDELRGTLNAWLTLLKYCEEQAMDLFIDSSSGAFEVTCSSDNGQMVATGPDLAPLARKLLDAYERDEEDFLQRLFPRDDAH